MSTQKTSKKSSKCEVVLEGPLYLCENCQSLIRVPEECLEEVIEEDEETNEEIVLIAFKCPACGEDSVIGEDEEDEEEEEEPVKEVKLSTKKSESKSKSKK